MGAYYNFVNPAKRQYIEDMSKYSTLMQTVNAWGVGLLLLDDRRVDEGPLSLIGSWAGDIVYLPNDSESGPANDTKFYRLPDGVLDSLDLYSLARDEYEEIGEQVDAMLEALTLGEGLRAVRDREPSSRPLLAAPYDNQEKYIVVCPQERQFMDPGLLGERWTIERVLAGWPGQLLGDLIIWGTWNAPAYVAGEWSRPNPTALLTSCEGHPNRNLFALATSEYEEITFGTARQMDRMEDIVRNADVNDSLLTALRDQAFLATIERCRPI